MSKYAENRFKDYAPNQTMLLPPSLDSLIPAQHPVRLVSAVIDQLDLDPLLAKYKGGGSSSYHPRMMLKVLVYAYIRNIYSSRKIELAIKEHIHFMWLSGGNEPDHNSINRFRSDRLGDELKTIFSQVVLLLHDAGHLSLKALYTDGTKIEANANRYTFVWGKSIQTNRKRIASQLEALWEYTQTVAKEELMDSEPCDFEELDPEQVRQTIEHIDQALSKQSDIDPKVKAKVKYGKKKWPEALHRYQEQQETMGERNSYSKTDPDATFMRMKDDHMQNGQLKPGYNLQMSSNEQFIVHYSIHANPSDTLTLIPHLQGFNQAYNMFPEQVTTDAGYGSEQNYHFLDSHQIDAYVKYNNFHREQQTSFQKKYPFHPNTLHYNADKDVLICPMGQTMRKIGTYTKANKNGFEQTLSRYQAQNCNGCPLRPQCHKAKTHRIVEVNHRAQHYRQQAKFRLTSPQGIIERKRRPREIEAVFGILKQNHAFKRFTLRTQQKVEIEAGLHALAHNFRKWVAKTLLTVTQTPKRNLLSLA